MPSTPFATVCQVAGLSVKQIGDILHCPFCGQRTRCRHRLKRHFSEQIVERGGKIRCTKLIDEESIAKEFADVVATDYQHQAQPAPTDPWPEADVADSNVVDIAAVMLECISGHQDHGQYNITSNCCHQPDEVDDRTRGGVAEEDPVDAAEFFRQYGLPNVLSDDEDEEYDVDTANAGEVGWPVHQLLKPLYPGSHYTVQQFAYAMLKIKTGSIRDDRADQLCKMIAHIMPSGFEGPRCVFMYRTNTQGNAV